jgi:hypothetical protein
MSVILEVLKKLDREKPSRRDHSPNIATEILRPDAPRAKRRIPLHVMIICVTAMVTAAVTYISIKEFGLLSRPSPPVLSRPPEPSRPVHPAPLESIPQRRLPPPIHVSPLEPAQKVVPIPPSREPVPETKGEVIKTVPKTEPVPENKITKAPETPIEGKPSSPPGEEKKIGQTALPAKKEIIPVDPARKSLETPATEPVKGPPSLNISAIVWYEDPSLRFAIVNGLKAVEGDLVEGVKVVEIHRTSIRFLYHHKQFEVSISR